MMGSRPPGLRLLILTSLLFIWQCSRGQSSYIIDTVGLTIFPESTVQSGTAVMIRCQAVVSRSNISHLDHLFLITRDDTAVHSSNTTKDSVQYELSPARAADSGSYECRVKVGDKSKSSISHRLYVTGLQTPTLNVSNTEPYEGEEFEATCSAPEEKGLFTFWFYRRFRNEEPEMTKRVQTMDNFARPTLSFRLRDECSLSCEYEINLLSGIRRSNRSKEIQLKVKALNIVPVINMVPSHSVYEGEVVEVICKVVDSPLKDINLFLTKDRKILKKVASTALSHRFTARDDGSGELVCKAEWGNVQKENYLSITVKQLFSKPKLTLEPIELFEGDNFEMICLVSFYVRDRISTDTMNFSIYKDDVRLSATNVYRTVAHPDKNGNYSCKVQLDSLVLVKESEKVFVRVKIPVSTPLLSVVGGTMLLGKPFQLVCQSARGTLPITYSLHGPNELFQRRVVRKPEEKAIFNVSAIFKITDLSKYLCHAKNSKNKPPEIGSGQQLQQSTKILEPVSKPILNILPGIDDISEGHSMTLVCSVQRGSPPINFTWFHIETEDPIASLTTNDLEVSYRIHNVRRVHEGSYYCVSTNMAKELKESRIVTVGVKLAGWKKGLIAVFCILLILLFILVIAFKTRPLHCKRKRTGKLSVKSAGTKVERLSLTQAEVNEAVNGTPGMMGKSLWSEHVSGSESDDQSSVIAPDKSEPQYTEVQITEGDPNRAPVNKGTETVYSEVRNSQQGVPEQADGQVSVEYAELNHDVEHPGDHSNHGNNSPNTDHVTETSNSDNCTDGQMEGSCASALDS